MKLASASLTVFSVLAIVSSFTNAAQPPVIQGDICPWTNNVQDLKIGHFKAMPLADTNIDIKLDRGSYYLNDADKKTKYAMTPYQNTYSFINGLKITKDVVYIIKWVPGSYPDPSQRDVSETYVHLKKDAHCQITIGTDYYNDRIRSVSVQELQQKD